jgi:hypothetical protein
MTCALAICGRACLVHWEESIAFGDVVLLLTELKRKRRELDGPLVLIAAIAGNTVYPPLAVRDALHGALPVLAACCDDVFIAVEGSMPRRDLFRMLWVAPPAPLDPRRRPRLFGSIEEALAGARAVAPHDVLRLQHLGLERSRRTSRGFV